MYERAKRGVRKTKRKERKQIIKCVDCFIDAEFKCPETCSLSGFGRQCQLFIIYRILEEKGGVEKEK